MKLSQLSQSFSWCVALLLLLSALKNDVQKLSAARGVTQLCEYECKLNGGRSLSDPFLETDEGLRGIFRTWAKRLNGKLLARTNFLDMVSSVVIPTG